MNKIYLSKSKYCRAKQCNKMLWLDKNNPEYAEEISNKSVLENGTKVGELAKNLFGQYSNIGYQEDLNVMIEETRKQLEIVPNVITEASFNYDNNFCSVDILKNEPDGIEIYEVKSSGHITDIYLDDVSYQVYILLNLGYKIKSVNLVYINTKYERHGELELNKLFNIEDVTEIAFSKQQEIKEKIEEIGKYMLEENEPEQDIGMQCFEPYECIYWKYCTRNLPKKNVFDVRDMRKSKKLDLYNKGIYSYEDLLQENLNPKFKQQIEFELFDKEPEINKNQIKEFLQNLYYPLYFLDFETFMQVIPKYDGIRPYMQIPFQYSLHYIETENGELKHTEFLAEVGEDPRRKLAERLVRDIPIDACVLSYNMTFEKKVIKELAEKFPDLKEHLMKIHDNLQDLIVPFRKKDYYLKEFEGSYSIKYVLPALFPDEPELNYHNLSAVHNGDEASNAFAGLEEKSKEEQEKIRKSLLEYCKLDTYAMVKILEKLKEI